MKILLAEYSVCAGISIANEGRAMLRTLERSFEKAGCAVYVPEDFDGSLATLARTCDCGLIIAPDDRLEKYTAFIENKCINLGCSSRVVRLCADKQETTELLLYNGLSAPRLVHEKDIKCVAKPRYGCASEGVHISQGPVDMEGYISTEFIDGEHLSVSLIGGRTILPLTLNRQHIHFEKNAIEYDGNDVNIEHPAKEEIFDAACKAGNMLGCKGLFGIDIVYGDKPYIVDVNPRPTTAVIGLARVLRMNVAELILQAHFGTLPDHVETSGHFTFTKDDLETIT
ncbi:MAG TPA: ATP-grasp domain-containing protein [Methanocellaceae archaeon]